MAEFNERLMRLAVAYRSSEATTAAKREAVARAIIEADAEGWSVRQIAAVTGFSSTHVHRLIGEGTARAQADVNA